MRPPVRRSRSALACVAIALAVALVMSVASCSRSSGDAKPSNQDALRAAQAAQDQIIMLTPKFVTGGNVSIHAYACAEPGTCRPAEGSVTRTLEIQGVTRVQMARFYIDNLVDTGWTPEAIFCDEGSNTYVVIATKKQGGPGSYPGRLEVLARETSELRISVPAFGSEASFAARPENAEYPTGACPAALALSMANAKQGGTPAGSAPATSGPAGSVPPGTG